MRDNFVCHYLTEIMDLFAAVWTFSHCAEGHVGHEIEKSKHPNPEAHSIETLESIKSDLEKKGAEVDWINLQRKENEPEAAVMVLRNGLKHFGVSHDDLMQETNQLPFVDKQYKGRDGKIKNKRARWNANGGDRHVDADIEKGINTQYHFDEVPVLKAVRVALEALHPTLQHVLAEGNFYNKDGLIRYHGDEERPCSPVVGVNLGQDRFIDFRSFYRHAFYGEQIRINLHAGDIYFMSEHAVGIGWIKSTYKKVIFRHRAGSKIALDKHDKELIARDKRKSKKRKEREEKRKEREEKRKK